MSAKVELAHRLRVARVSARYTSIRVADALGVAPQSVSAWEREGRGSTPSDANLEKLARLYGVTVAWLQHGRPAAAVKSNAAARPEIDKIRERLLERGQQAGWAQLAREIGGVTDDALSLFARAKVERPHPRTLARITAWLDGTPARDDAAAADRAAGVPGAEWLADVALQSCSLRARGLWVELQLRMRGATPAGQLSVNGKAIADAAAAKLVNASPVEYRAALRELLGAGVVRRTATGVLYAPALAPAPSPAREG